MKTHAILSVLGPDRVGVASDLAATMERHGLHIETSRMTGLEGRFAVLMAISGEQSNVTNFRVNLSTLGAELGFDLHLDALDTVARKEPAPKTTEWVGRNMLIESFSAEPSGLNAITEVLKRRCVNIEELVTEVSSASCTSPETFHMRARVEVPESCSVERLREELRDLQRGRDLDIEVKRGREIRDPLIPEKVR